MTPITWYLYGRSGGAKKAVEEIGVKESVSGDIAVISDGANDVAVKSLVAEITPVQSGSGDPSPTNIRPISGRTGLTVTRSGKNLLYTDADQQSINGITIVKNADGTYTLNGTATAQVDAYLDNVDVAVPNGEYLYNGITVGSPQTYRIYLSVRKGNSTRYIGTNDGDASVTLTDETIRAFVRIFNGAVLRDVVIKPMLRPATITDDTYEPYTTQTYPITWESIAGTVYGGTLDVVSGVLTVTHGYILLDGSQAIRANGRTAVTQRAFVNIAGKAFGRTNIQSNRFSTPSTSEEKIGYMGGRDTNNGVEFYLPLEGTADEDASCKQWFADNNTQLVYELATPQTYQLTPTEVRTILGGNTIYTDAGSVSVEYVADTKLYIDNKVAELQALILEN